MTLRKRGDIGKCKAKHYIVLCIELALEKALDLS